VAPLLLHGALAGPAAYWYAVVGFHLASHSALSKGVSTLGALGQTAPAVLVALLPLWVLAVLGTRARSDATAASNPRRRWFLLAFLAGSVAGAALGGSWFWHYYVGVLPAASVLAGAGAVAAWRLSDAYPGRTVGSGARWPAWAAVPVLLAAVSVVFNARVVGATPEETSWRLYRRPAYLAGEEIAAYVRERTDEDDTIYVAFAQADLYYLAERRSAGQQLYWADINRVPGALEAVMAALDDPEERPAYVVKVDETLEEPARAEAFWEVVNEHYELEETIEGFLLYRARD
jgi:hypothetical protein